MKGLFFLIVAVALIALIVAVVWLAIDNARLRRRMNGLDEPELWLPRSERRAHARKLLKREDEAYEQQMIVRLSEAIQGGKPYPTTKGEFQ
jgi:hypothetical protein